MYEVETVDPAAEWVDRMSGLLADLNRIGIKARMSLDVDGVTIWRGQTKAAVSNPESDKRTGGI